MNCLTMIIIGYSKEVHLKIMKKINAHTVALIQRLQQSIKKNGVFLISQRLWHRSVLNSKERH